jgi:hypothetical protein
VRRIALLLAAVLSVGSLAACGRDPVADTTALQFEAPLVGGGRVDFRSLSGEAVALWFWAPG